MRPFLAALLTATLIGAAAPPALAADALRVENPWARATSPAAKAGGAYMTVTNTGAEPDRLTAAATPNAERAELHIHIMDNGIMRMREVEGGIPIPPGETVTLEPGGLHVMLMGLKQPLVQGERFPLTLTFERAGTIPVEVSVESIAAKGPAGARHHGASHNHSMPGSGSMPGK